jgi:hypothetical protein
VHLFALLRGHDRLRARLIRSTEAPKGIPWTQCGQPVVSAKNHRSTPFALVSRVRPRYSVSGRLKTEYACALHKTLVSLKVRCLLPGGLKARRSGQIEMESHRVAGAEPGALPSRSSATTLTDRNLSRPLPQRQTLARRANGVALVRRGMVEAGKQFHRVNGHLHLPRPNFVDFLRGSGDRQAALLV